MSTKNHLQCLWKICNYRPYRIIPRDPNESTYETGDDKFPAVDFSSPGLAKRIVEEHNALAGIGSPASAIEGARKALAELSSLVAYCGTVRMDRKDDTQEFTLQTVDWCEGLIEYAERADAELQSALASLTPAKEQKFAKPSPASNH